jgi:hypothetical protein
MRNLREIMKEYKNSLLPLDYFIYKYYVDKTNNLDEKYAIL